MRKDKKLNKRLMEMRDRITAYVESRLVKDTEKDNPHVLYCKRSEVNLELVESFLEENNVKLDAPAPGGVSPEKKQTEVFAPITTKYKTNTNTVLDKLLAEKEETFSEMLLRLIDEKGLKDSEVYKMANIDRRLFSKIRGDSDYVPSKKTAISFCLALRLDIRTATKLLWTAGYALSLSSRFDLIIRYLIEHEEYDIHFANIVLDDYGESILSR